MHIGVARIFDSGRGPKPQITCNDVNRTFRKRNFLWDKDIVKWKTRSRGLFYHIKKQKWLNLETCVSELVKL